MCSLEVGSYLLWYREVSETSPLFLLHVTVGVGSPMTIALKKANFPVKKGKKEDRSLPGDSEEIQIYTVTFSMDIKLKWVNSTW